MPGLKLEITVDDKGAAKITNFQKRWEGAERRVIGGASKISSAWGKMGSGFDKLSQRMNRGLMYMKLAILGVISATVIMGAKFEQAMAKVSSVAGASASQMQELITTARKWGQVTAFSASQVADAMYSLASGGLKTKEIIQSVGAVLMFAGAGATSMGQAAETVIQTLKQFGLEAGSAVRVVNVLAAGIANSMLTADRLKEALSMVGATAAAVGMDIEKTVGALALLHNAGILGSMAGTYLKNVFVNLARPNTVLRRLLGDVSLETEGLSGVMQHLADIGASTGDIFAAFGRRAAPAVLTFMKLGKERMDAMTESVTGTQKAFEMYKQQMDTTIGDFRILKSAIEENMIAAFEKMKGTIRPALQMLINLMIKLKPAIVELTQTSMEWINRHKTMIGVIAALGAGFIATLAVIVIFGQTIRIVISSVQVLGSILMGTIGIIGRLSAVVIANPWLLLVAAIAMVIFAVIKYREKLATAFKEMGGQAAWLGKEIWKGISWAWDKLATGAEAAGKKIWEGFKWYLDKITWPFRKLGGLFEKLFPDATEAIKKFAEQTGEKVEDVAAKVFNMGKDAGGAVVDAAKTVASGTANAAKTVAGKAKEMKGNFVGDLEDMKTKVQDFIASIGGPVNLKIQFEKEQKEEDPWMKKDWKNLIRIEPAPGSYESFQQFYEYFYATEGETLEKIRTARMVNAYKTVGMEKKYTNEWLIAKKTVIDQELQDELNKTGVTAIKEAQLRIEHDQKVKEAEHEHIESVWEHWQRTHKMQMVLIGSLGAAYDTFFDTLLDKEMTGKKRREEMWKSMERSFISSTSKMLKAYLTMWIKNLLLRDIAEKKSLMKERLEYAKLGAIRAYTAFASIPIIGPILGAAAAAAAFGFLMAFHKGGLVKEYNRSFGGLKSNEVPAILERREYVVQQRSVTKETLPTLQYINQKGKVPSGGDLNVQFNISGGQSDDTRTIMEYLEDEVAPRLQELNKRRRFKLKVSTT